CCPTIVSSEHHIDQTLSQSAKMRDGNEGQNQSANIETIPGRPNGTTTEMKESEQGSLNLSGRARRDGGRPRTRAGRLDSGQGRSGEKLETLGSYPVQVVGRKQEPLSNLVRRRKTLNVSIGGIA